MIYPIEKQGQSQFVKTEESAFTYFRCMISWCQKCAISPFDWYTVK